MVYVRTNPELTNVLSFMTSRLRAFTSLLDASGSNLETGLVSVTSVAGSFSPSILGSPSPAIADGLSFCSCSQYFRDLVSSSLDDVSRNLANSSLNADSVVSSDVVRERVYRCWGMTTVGASCFSDLMIPKKLANRRLVVMNGSDASISTMTGIQNLRLLTLVRGSP